MLFISCSNHERQLAQANKFLQNQEIVQAKLIYQRLLDSEPENVEAIIGMISVAEIDKATEEHIHWNKQLLRFRPWDRQANIIIGKQLMKEGNYADAVSRFVLALEESEFRADKHEVQQLLAQVYQLSHQ